MAPIFAKTPRISSRRWRESGSRAGGPSSPPDWRPGDSGTLIASHSRGEGGSRAWTLGVLNCAGSLQIPTDLIFVQADAPVKSTQGLPAPVKAPSETGVNFVAATS